MEEIIEHVYYEIKSSNYENKLIGGIVITGGGAQLKHVTQLVEFITGFDCRVGYPTEHLAKNEALPKNVYEDLKSPMYATGIGLLMKGIQKIEDEMLKDNTTAKQTKISAEPTKSKGLFASIIEGSKKFIKDDISDTDFLK
jgi:cell division protein FtsA